jgi:hypothetical protein
MTVIREILIFLENSDYGHDKRIFEIEGYTLDEINYNCSLIYDAGLAEGIIATSFELGVPHVMLKTLTWDGHEFLDASRDSDRWEKAKSVSSKLGGVTISAMMDILQTIISEQIKSTLNIN